jgi:hypothetical protein
VVLVKSDKYLEESEDIILICCAEDIGGENEEKLNNLLCIGGENEEKLNNLLCRRYWWRE